MSLNETLSTITVRPFERADEAAVIALWHTCSLVVPWNDPARDIAGKMQVNPELFLVAVEGGRVVGTVMVGYDGHRGWINYLGVLPQLRRRGVGRLLMQEAEARLRARGCPKINLQVRTSNLEVIEFYKRIGFKEDAVVSFGKRL
jgi:ribosomal protein S18 acetylase RimI-like enzyme